MPRRARPRLDREVLRLRQVALDAAAAGLFVFPVKAGSKIPAFHGETRCRRRGPCAEGHQGWEQRATRDPAQIRRWWSNSTRWNVGIACGPSGLVVIDLDTRTEPLAEWDGATTGREVLDQLVAQHSEVLPDTYSTVTPTVIYGSRGESQRCQRRASSVARGLDVAALSAGLQRRAATATPSRVGDPR